MDLLSLLSLLLVIIGACYVLLKIAEYNFPRKSLRLDNLTDGTTDLEIRALCESYGEVEVVNIRSWEGFASVHFRDPTEANRARRALNHMYLHGQEILTQWETRDRFGNIAHPLYRLAVAVFWYVLECLSRILVGCYGFIASRLRQENEIEGLLNHLRQKQMTCKNETIIEIYNGGYNHVSESHESMCFTVGNHLGTRSQTQRF